MDALASLAELPTVDMSLTAREVARREGRDTYFTGKSCIRGHVAERSVANSDCVECRQDRLGQYRKQGSRGRYAGEMYGFREPYWWSDDGTNRREPVVDLATNRVVRLVGYVRCLSSSGSPHRFFSPDVRGVRTCDRCKHTAAINQSNQGCEN